MSERAPFLVALSDEARHVLRTWRSLQRPSRAEDALDGDLEEKPGLDADDIASVWARTYKTGADVDPLMAEVAEVRRACVRAMGRLPSPLGRATPERLAVWYAAWTPLFRTWKTLVALTAAVESIRSVIAFGAGEMYEPIDWLGSVCRGEHRSPEHSAYCLFQRVGKRIYERSPRFLKARRALDAKRYQLRGETLKARMRERRQDPAVRAREAATARARYHASKARKAESARMEAALAQIDKDHHTDDGDPK